MPVTADCRVSYLRACGYSSATRCGDHLHRSAARSASRLAISPLLLVEIREQGGNDHIRLVIAFERVGSGSAIIKAIAQRVRWLMMHRKIVFCEISFFITRLIGQTTLNSAEKIKIDEEPFHFGNV
jgi:hypothetical protein